MIEQPDHARGQARAQLENITALTATWVQADNDDDIAQALEAIYETPLSVEIRDTNWYNPGNGPVTFIPVEFRICLCTGGPAVQIIGAVDIHGNPTVTALQYQDWGTPWTEYFVEPQEYDDLQSFAQHFYFGD